VSPEFIARSSVVADKPHRAVSVRQHIMPKSVCLPDLKNVTSSVQKILKNYENLENLSPKLPSTVIRSHISNDTVRCSVWFPTSIL